MKSTNIINIILLVAVGVLIFLWLRSRQAASGHTSRLKHLSVQLDEARVQNGIWENEFTGLERAYEDVYAELLQTKMELQNLGADTKGMTSAAKIKIYIRDTVQLNPVTETVYTDSVRWDTAVVGFSHHDEWADINVSKELFWWTLDYTVRDSIYFITKEKKGPWGRSVIGIEGVSANPNTVIYGLDYFEISPKPKRWGVGPQLGVGFDGHKLHPYLGVGISYNLIQF